MAADLSQPSTSNFINIWLARRDPLPAYTAFQHIFLVENSGVREIVFTALAETVFIHHNDPEEFRVDLERLGYPELAETLDMRPCSLETRMGNFGEILASEYLHQCEGYRIPIYRLRDSSNRDSSMKGDDVLAFKFGETDGRGREILVVEAKVRSQFSTETIRETYEQVEKRHRIGPTSIRFVVRVLRKEGRDDEADQVLTFLNRFAPHQPIQRHMIFLVTGNRPRDPFGYIQGLDQVIDNLIAANLYISGLRNFVNALFDCEVWINGS